MKPVGKRRASQAKEPRRRMRGSTAMTMITILIEGVEVCHKTMPAQ